jgi:hypothetical protein
MNSGAKVFLCLLTIGLVILLGRIIFRGSNPPRRPRDSDSSNVSGGDTSIWWDSGSHHGAHHGGFGDAGHGCGGDAGGDGGGGGDGGH